MSNSANATSIDKGKTYIIQSFTNRKMAVRMLSMGILPGQTMRIINKSPFGSCYYISVGKRWIAIRAEELSAITWSEADQVT